MKLMLTSRQRDEETDNTGSTIGLRASMMTRVSKNSPLRIIPGVLTFSTASGVDTCLVGPGPPPTRLKRTASMMPTSRITDQGKIGRESGGDRGCNDV